MSVIILTSGRVAGLDIITNTFKIKLWGITQYQHSHKYVNI